MNDAINARIQSLINTLLPNGAGLLTDVRLRTALEQVAQVAFTQGKNHALAGLMTAEQVADELGVSYSRARALIKTRHDRFGVGMKAGSAWLIHRDELDTLRPGPEGWPKGRSRKQE